LFIVASIKQKLVLVLTSNSLKSRVIIFVFIVLIVFIVSIIVGELINLSSIIVIV